MDTFLIPEQKEGKHNDLEHSVSLVDMEEAGDCFRRAKKRLLNPKIWHELGGIFSAEFVLVDSAGETPRRLAQVGDMYRIDLPGPGPKAGNGYDWVRVDAIDDRSDDQSGEELFALRLVPTCNPYNRNPATAHFFTASASSTFILRRNGTEVTASYHGRNETANRDTNSGMDNVRNAVMGSAALAGLSELQWTSLLHSLLSPELGG